MTDHHWPHLVEPGATLGDLASHFTPGEPSMIAVVSGGRYLGLITLPELHRIMEDETLAHMVIAQDLMSNWGPILTPDQDVYSALETFRHVKQDAIPVVSHGVSRHWVGMLTRWKIYELVQEQIATTREFILREHAGLLAMDQKGRMNELLSAFTPGNEAWIERLMVPLNVVSQSLRQSQFNSRYNVEVVAIEESDGSLQCPPDMDRPLRSEHRLLAIVKRRTPCPSEEGMPGNVVRQGPAVDASSDLSSGL